MFLKILRIIFYLFFINFFTFNYSLSDNNRKFKITGNKRISSDTILMFADINNNNLSDKSELNKILKNIYNSNYFENVSVKFETHFVYKC